MKLIWVGSLLLLFASVANLISNRLGGRLIDETWMAASHVLPKIKRSELQRVTRAYTAGIFARLPEPLRQKFANKAWNALELMTLRSLILWHVVPALLIAVIAGLLEGQWARANQKALVNTHSPMRFTLALTSLGFTPFLAVLWICSPMAMPPTLPVIALGTLVIVNTRNLVVHTPTRF